MGSEGRLGCASLVRVESHSKSLPEAGKSSAGEQT